ncbi:CPBP family intramembrane glutamic endopeptidase [Rhodohalobacter sp. 614A]|uniref:CPBP family intramembrane glutamic endopeptidase n=1 Tax=Rhodohalobacter sp. 614A TaxID=2908649 RepID=UPI001F416A1B|nr:CPBP family intramembrane glutamic endopeptidase [Rhodohalobacter sp. 614A]
MINELISAVLQILIFAALPFVFYLTKMKKTEGFFDYIGLKKSNPDANLSAIFLSLLIAGPLLLLSMYNSEFFGIMSDPSSMTGKFRQMEFNAESVIILIVGAVFKTSLAEEILFRGFIAKRLIALTNYKIGNILQAVLFGLIHSALFLFVTDSFFFLMVIFLFPAIASYIKVYLNEKVADGSIIPGWIAHAIANLLAYSTIGFMI